MEQERTTESTLRAIAQRLRETAAAQPLAYHEPFFEIAHDIETLADPDDPPSHGPIPTSFIPVFPKDVMRDVEWTYDPPPPGEPELRVKDWKGRLFAHYWRLRWELAERIAGEPITDLN